MGIPYTLVEKSVLRKVGSPIPIGDILVETKAWMETLESQSSITNFYYYAEVIDGETKNRWFVYSDMARAYFNLSDNYIAADSASVASTPLPQFKTINGQNLVGTGNIEIASTPLPQFKTINNQELTGTGNIEVAASLPQFKTINNQNLVGTGNIEIAASLPQFKTINGQELVGTGNIEIVNDKIHSWSTPLLSDLDSLIVTADDIMKIAFVSETDTFFVLLSVSPVKWVQIGNNSISVTNTPPSSESTAEITVVSSGIASIIPSVGTSKAPVTTCPLFATEGTTITFTISDYISTNTYQIGTTMGTVTRTGANITWKMPFVQNDTLIRIVINCTQVGKTATGSLYDLTVKNIPVTEDSSLFYSGSSIGEFTALYNTNISGNTITKGIKLPLIVINNKVYTDGLTEINDLVILDDNLYTIDEIITTADGANNITGPSIISPLSSITSSEGMLIVSSFVVGFEGWKAFDNLTTSEWKSSTGTINGSFVGFDFNISRKINKYNLNRTIIDISNAPISWEIQASNDNITWTTLHTVTDNTTFTATTFTFVNSKSYKSYRIYITANNGGLSSGICSIDFFSATEEIIRTTPAIPTAVKQGYVISGFAKSNIITQNSNEANFKSINSPKVSYSVSNISNILSYKDTLVTSTPLITGDKINIIDPNTSIPQSLVIGNVDIEKRIYVQQGTINSPFSIMPENPIKTGLVFSGGAPFRGYCANYSDGEYFYRFSGHDGSNWTQSAYRCRIGADMAISSNWESGSMPWAYHPVVFEIGEFVYIFGGSVSASSAANKTLYKCKKGSNLLLAANRVSLGVVGPDYITGAVTFDDGVFIYLIGGSYSTVWAGAASNKVLKLRKTLDPAVASNWTVGSFPTAFNYSASLQNSIIVDNGMVYFIVGHNGSAYVKKIYKAVFGSDLSNPLNWSEGSTPISFIYGYIMQDAEYVYYIGGYNGSVYLSSAYRAKLGTDMSVAGNWTLISNFLPGTMAFGSAFSDNKNCYIIGGYTSNYTSTVYKIPLYNTNTAYELPTLLYKTSTLSVTNGITPTIVYKEINNIEFMLDDEILTPSERTDTATYNIMNNTNTISAIVPMTSNTAPYGEVSSSTLLSTTANFAWHAFDSSLTSLTKLSGTSGYIQYKFNRNILITKYSIIGFKSGVNILGNSPKDWDLLGSSDGVTWNTLHSIRGNTSWGDGVAKYFSFVNMKQYVYFRLNILANNGDTVNTDIISFGLQEFELPRAIDVVSTYSDAVSTIGGGRKLQAKVKLHSIGETIKEIFAVIGL